jgi:hypothetical protein
VGVWAWERAHRSAEKALVKRGFLTLGVLALSLVRFAELQEVQAPLAITGVSLLVVWLDERVLTDHVARLLLTFSIALQVFAYTPHFGALLTFTLGTLGLAVVWARDIAHLLGAREHVLNLPAPVHEHVRRHKRTVAGVAGRLAKRLKPFVKPNSRIHRKPR